MQLQRGDMVMTNETGKLRALVTSSAGNVFPLTAAAVFVLAGLVGGGVDMSRAYMVQNRLQNACDAGVLAGRKAVGNNGFDATAEAVADSYFNVNFANEANVSGTAFNPTSADQGSTIDGTASTTVDTTVMKLFGFTQVPLSVSCMATMQVSNSDIVMVLDNTGSMGWALSGSTGTRMDALQDAMDSFYTTMADATQGTNARVRYGFVPYNTTVNVGKLVYGVNPAYIADTNTIQSREARYVDIERDTDEVESYEDPVYDTQNSTTGTTASNWVDHTGSYRRRRDCRDREPNNTSWSNSGTATTTTHTYTDANDNRITETVTRQPQSRTVYRCEKKSNRNYWVQRRTETRDSIVTQTATEEPVYKKETITEFDRYVYKPVTYDTSAYKTGSSVTTVTGDDGANVSSTWDGCIEERGTVASGSISYNSLTGVSPSGAYDIDINSAPTNDATRWKAYWPELAYYRYTNSGYYTNSDSLYGSKATTRCGVEAQLMRTMTQAEYDAYVDSLITVGNTYHDIGFIWGARLASPSGIFSANVLQRPANNGNVSRHLIFLTDGDMDTNFSQYTSWGIEIHDRRVTDDGYTSNDSRHTARLLAACSAAKAEGIRVWVIAFATAMTSALESCASDDSDFTAANSSELTNHFQDIANQIGELRVVQ